MPHYLHFARKGEAALYSIMSPEALRPVCIELKGPMLFLFFLSSWQRKAWALIRKTQSHIITLDETKEDNPVVRLEYFIIELNYSCLLTYHGALAFCAEDAICCQSSIKGLPTGANAWYVGHAEAPHGLDPCWQYVAAPQRRLNRLTQPSFTTSFSVTCTRSHIQY